MADLSELPREFPRFEVNAYVDYTGNEVLLYHRIQNISLGGVCIQSSGVEDVGTTVDLVINFPELSASLAVKGEVVWVNRTARWTWASATSTWTTSAGRCCASTSPWSASSQTPAIRRRASTDSSPSSFARCSFTARRRCR